jgi:Rps23 Pro-64 3,4-dihydroxylase Tpa1-like proline 4-hydroxylase
MKYFTEVLSHENYEYVVNKTLHGDGWRFMGFSNRQDPFKFWFLDLSSDPFFADQFLPVIENLSGKKFELERVYANGQTYGLPGSIHRDVETDYAPELYYTFVYYVNPVWDVSWGGNTVFINENGSVDNVLPLRNTGMLFRSDILHYGSEPTRHCPELRVTVAFKLKELI